MKKQILFLLFALASMVSNAQDFGYALLLGFSQVDNAYQDENLKIEFYGRSLWVTNLTDQNLYLDKQATTIMENEYSYSLSEVKENSQTTFEAPMTIGPKAKKKLKDVLVYFGSRKFDSRKAVAFYLYKPYPFDDDDISFVNTVGELYSEIGVKPVVTSASKHFTQDESFMRFSASVVYSKDAKMKDPIQTNISSWCSDVILTVGKAVLPQKEKSKSLIVARGRELDDLLYCYADQPFEYEEDKSPIMPFAVSLELAQKGILQLNWDIQELASLGQQFRAIYNDKLNNNCRIIWKGNRTFSDKKSYKEFIKEFKSLK